MECVREFSKKESLLTQLGHDLCSDLHRVTPGSIMRAAPLLCLLIEAGCAYGVILPSKLDVAVKLSLHDKSCLPHGRSAELYANQVTEHIRVLLAMLRTSIMENEELCVNPLPFCILCVLFAARHCNPL